MPKVNVIDDFFPKSIFEKLSDALCINGIDNRKDFPDIEQSPPFTWVWTSNSLPKGNLIPPTPFPWLWNDTHWDGSEWKQEKDSSGQFVHMFYDIDRPTSPLYDKFIFPLWEILDVFCPIRCRAVMIPQAKSIIKQGFHIDIPRLSPEKIDACTTAILYMNTNDGYSELEDGQKIESIANRLVTFPASLKHSGTTCTNQPHRTTLNFNYISFK